MTHPVTMTEPDVFEDRIGPTGEGYGEEMFSEAEFELRADMELSHYWHLHRREVIRDELERGGVSRESRLIEIGCGIGTQATYLNEQGFSVDYADIHKSALSIARQKATQALGERSSARRFLRVDITRAPLGPGYDGVLLLDVLEHLDDDVTALTNATSDLPPGAPVLFTVPAFRLLWSPWDDLEHHKRRYTEAQVCALADAAGLDVQRSTCFFFPLFFAALGVKALRAAKGLVADAPSGSTDIRDMAETKTSSWLNRVALTVLAAENPLRRSLGLGLGTSVLCLARKR